MSEGVDIGYVDQLFAYLGSGGTVMVPLVILAMVLWFGIGWRLHTLRRGNRRSVRVLVEKYRAGYARRPRGIIDSVVVKGLKVLDESLPYLRRRLDDALYDDVLEMTRFSMTVRGIVAAAPLLGLLGTVAGMIETFDSLGDMSLFSQSGGIAGGISLALFTTQMGLAVAIPGLLVGRVLEHRQRAFEAEIEKLKDILCSWGDGAKA